MLSPFSKYQEFFQLSLNYHLSITIFLTRINQTYASNSLIVINPFESLPIYSAELVKEYAGKCLGEMQPHIFGIGKFAFIPLCIISTHIM